MVLASKGGPTYRLGVFVDSILKPIAIEYCQNEYLQDTNHFIRKIKAYNSRSDIVNRPGLYVCTLDICALYPSVRMEHALDSIHDALNLHTNMESKQIEMVIELVKFCFENSVVHYRGKWYISLEGLPTGGPESSSIANIFVHWLLDKILLPHPRVKAVNNILDRDRFLDDIFALWNATPRTFKVFLNTVNNIAMKYGIQFTGECSKKANFLDTTVEIEGNELKTDMFVKPTDADQYLHRRSHHPLHMFKSIPFSQYRRAVLICTDPTRRVENIKRITNKFLKSGYSFHELYKSEILALSISREILLDTNKENVDTDGEVKTITFVLPFCTLKNELKSVISEYKDDIKQITGLERVIFAEKRHSNISSLLFAKSSFSENAPTNTSHQKCMSHKCMSCNILNLPKSVTINNFKIKLDFALDCSSKCVVYLALCRHCKMNFYFGQTMDTFRNRMNGHRDKFSLLDEKYTKSALSWHIYKEHCIYFNDKLENFKLGIIQQVMPVFLDKREDFYIYITKADMYYLNRYKVVK